MPEPSSLPLPAPVAEAPDETTPAAAPAPWERRAGEGSRPFAALKSYRSTPPAERSLARVAGELGISTALCERWSARWEWQQRVRAWDEECDRATRSGFLRRLEALGEQQAEQASEMAAAILAPAREVARRLEGIGKDQLAEMPLETLLRLSVRGAAALPSLQRGQREAVGTATGDSGGEEMSKVSDADLVARFTLVTGELVRSLRRPESRPDEEEQ